MKTVFKILICVAFSIGFFTSCKKKLAVKDPPKIKAELVLSLFHALEDGDHAVAIEKIRRLRELKDNTFLANLEIQEKQNLVIKQIQSAIDEGKIDEAISICEKGIGSLNRNERLIQTKEELLHLKKIQLAVETVSSARDWVSLARSAAVLKMISLSYPPATPLASVAKEKLAEAKKIMLREHRLAIIDLAAELVSMKSKNDKYSDVVSLSLSSADPLNPALNLSVSD